MRNKCFKLFLSLFLIVLFTNKVYAGVVCNPDDEEVTITETGITDAGFDATLPLCKWNPTGAFSPVGGGHSSYQEAYDSGYDTEYKLVESYDGKDLMGVNVPICSDANRTVSATVTCTDSMPATHHYRANSCSSKTNQSTCASAGCTWIAAEPTAATIQPGEGGGRSVGYCTGNNGYNYYECPAGYNPAGRHDSAVTCTKEVTKSGSVSSDADGDALKDAAQAECGSSCTCQLDYILNCPVYACQKIYKNMSLCTPDFRIDDQPAYCVNPSQRFNGGRNNYQYDASFNVLDCANSYSTVDCGYANILIEGAYYDAPDDSINTALRLWSIYSGQVGDEKTGVANLTGPNCDNITYFMMDGDHYLNVYKQTFNYIMEFAREKFYDVAKRMEHIPEEESATSRGELKGNTFEKILCLNSDEIARLNNGTGNARINNMRGVMCGDSSEYRIGFELYFNTLIGNKYMKEHLGKLYGGGDGVKPTGATLQTEVSLEEGTAMTNKTSWVEVTFEHEAFWEYLEDQEVKCSESALNELRDKLISEGKTTAEADAIINQIKPYCKVKVVIRDEDGNELVTEQDMEKCIKGTGCRTTKFRFAICDITNNNEKDIEISVTYERSNSSYSVRKYYSCSNANVNQTLFAFFAEDRDNDGDTDEGEETGRTETEKTFSVTNYKCAGGCDNTSLRTDGDGSCKNDQNNYNGVYSSSIKDPSLKCIVNMNDSAAKTKYDYSNYFGVNTNFCRVYCSDEVKYTLADKVKAISGRTFNYDIEFAARGTNKLNYKLSTIVEEKRTCVSEIYYNHLANIDVLKSEYGLTDSEFAELKESKTFAGLFNVLKKKASGENERNENLNQIIYDIYNCNFYSKKAIEDAGVTLPRNYTSTLNGKVKDIYSESNNYGLGSDRNGNKTENTSTDVVKYGFGAVIKDSDNRVNNVSNKSTFTGKLSSVSYCKDRTGDLCYSYDSNYDELSYNYPANRAGEKKTYTLHRGKNIDVPTNDYARFEVSAEINYYNNNKYQADYGSGKVVLGGNNSELLTIPNYSYPIDKNAYNLDACRTSLDGGKYHRCSVSQVVNPLTFYRNDSAYKLTVNDDNQFRCYVDVEVPSPSCDPSKANCVTENATLYRNVDPSNLFPSGTKNNSNWNTADGILAREEIESSADDLKTDDKYLDYSITVSPSQIRNIRDYNNTNGGYSEELIYNCEKDPVDGIYYNCNSYFMDVLRGNAAEYSSGTYGNINTDRKND